MKLHEMLRAARKKAGRTQLEVAIACGVKRQSVVQWEAGDTKPSTENLLVALAFLDADIPAPDDLITEPPKQIALGKNDLPVYAAAEGGPGEMVVSTDAIDMVPRPWYLGEVKDGYAVLVVGESMEPAFEPGDMAVVNPRLPPQRGRDVILVADDGNGKFSAMIKRLVGWNATEWRVRQFNPPLEFSVPRAKWPKALRVVGKYTG